MSKFYLFALLMSWSALALADPYSPSTATHRPHSTGREEIAFNDNAYYSPNWQSNSYSSGQVVQPNANDYYNDYQNDYNNGYGTEYIRVNKRPLALPYRNWDYGTNWRFNRDAYLSGEEQSQYIERDYQDGAYNRTPAYYSPRNSARYYNTNSYQQSVPQYNNYR
jgi:hypothetical protein